MALSSGITTSEQRAVVPPANRIAWVGDRLFDVDAPALSRAMQACTPPMTVCDLARECGVTRSYVRRILRGAQARLREDTVVSMMVALALRGSAVRVDENVPSVAQTALEEAKHRSKAS